ncbi:MAG: subunit 2 of glycine dehydrogenase, partial [Paenibacillus sp.]|nr:subunit 2 of glycine dehydrogenase [Paenibacillus sp.]
MSTTNQTETKLTESTAAEAQVKVKHDKALIFELSKPGRVAYSLPECDVPEVALDELIPQKLLRAKPAELP